MLLSGVDLDRLQNHSQSINVTQLQQCLTLLNSRVQDETSSTNDHTLLAVAALAAMEHDRGNMRALKMHLDGLKRIVELRGGLDKVRQTNPMVANVVFWCAMISTDEPSLLSLTFDDALEYSEHVQGSVSATLLTHDGGQADLLEFGVDVVTANILHEVQRLSRLYTSRLDYETPEEAIEVLSSLCSVLERLLQLSKSPSDESPIAGLSQSCRIAGCLHVFTPLSG